MKKYHNKKFTSFKTVIKSADIFSAPSRLSLKQDSFILVEYVE